MTKKWLLPGSLALFIPSVIALSLHGYLGSFSRFMGDDFCAAYIADRFGILRAVWYWYLNWNGGYTVSILGELLPLIKPRGMAYVISILLAIWFTITCIVIGLFLPRGAKTGEKVWASLSLGGAVLFVILLLSPNVPQSFYWWAGMRPYTMPLIGITFYALLYQWYRRGSPEKREVYIWVGISFLAALFNGGLSETFTPVQIVFFATLTGWIFIRNKAGFRDRDFLFPFAGLIGSIVALVIMISAPGNAIRRSQLPPAPDLFTVLRIAFSGYSAFLLDIFSTKEKIIGLIGLALGAVWIGMQFKSEEKTNLLAAATLFLGGFIFAFGCFPPGAYGLAEPPPGRTHIIPDFMLVVGFLTSGVITGNWLGNQLDTSYRNIVNLGFIVLITGCMGYASFMNSTALYSSRQEYAAYAQNWDEAEKILLQASQTDVDTVYIPALTNWAHVFDPRDNPRFYVNECIAKYYQVNQVIAIDNPPVPSP
jgi:hypothetical protein